MKMFQMLKDYVAMDIWNLEWSQTKEENEGHLCILQREK